MNLVTITDNIALVAASITGIRGAYGQEPDAVPGTPFVIVGLPRAFEVIPGNRTVTNMAIPVRLYIERLSDEKRDARIAYGYVATFITTFALDQSLGGTVSDCTITGWDTNQFDAVAGATYAVVEFTASVTVHEAVPQALRTVL